MPLLNMRELLQFPEGDNSTDTVLNGVHFNLTALKEFNYTIYSNNTVSNNSNCYLIFDNFKPTMLSNGSWVNATTCYIPYYKMKGRGIASVAFASFFCVSIMFTLINLRKHGRLFLREDKRFRVVGRRWQWYWMLFVAACGMISTITGIDVDRYYLQELPIVLQSFFFLLMVPGALAMVWEATRHWYVLKEPVYEIQLTSTGAHGKKDSLSTPTRTPSRKMTNAPEPNSGSHSFSTSSHG
jgi:hypothetical protein